MINNQIDLLPIDEFKIKYPHYAQRFRWGVFERCGTKCCACDATGTHALIWHDNHTERSIHSDMVALTKGGMTLMTMDHIIPKSKGGPKHINNLRTMCAPCNEKKGSKIDVSFSRFAIPLVVLPA